jgi:dTDP-4-dehydrorhamnose reductase
MKILILGHNGMLGNIVHKYFVNKYIVETIGKLSWDSQEFKTAVLDSTAEYIINGIGAIPQKKYPDNFYEFLNVELPIFLESSGKKIIHPSTDCEFSGKLEYPQKYSKDAMRDADDIYGMSKAKIGKLIVETFTNTKIIRTSIIGHEKIGHFSLLDWFLSTKDDEILNGYANYYWNGITTLQWCKIAEGIMLNWNNSDILTQVGVDELNKCDLLKIMRKVYSKSNIINEYQMEKSLNKMLVSDILIPNIEEQLMELKNFCGK